MPFKEIDKIKTFWNEFLAKFEFTKRRKSLIQKVSTRFSSDAILNIMVSIKIAIINKHCIFKWPCQGSLLYIFVLFKQLLDFNGIEMNLYFQSREQARWPLELRHGPTNVLIYYCESSGGDWFSRGPPRVRSQQSKIIMSKWLIEQSQIWKELGKRRCDETKINLASFHQNFCLKILQRSASG